MAGAAQPASPDTVYKRESLEEKEFYFKATY
jgi:hypothetical protein